MSFFAELKRRNVFRVAIAYAVTAWLLAQIADVAFDNFGTPDWVGKTVLFLLVLGFPVAVFFAWVFELTPEGIKLEKDVDRSQSVTHETGRKLNYLIIGGLAVAVTFLLIERFFLLQESERAAGTTVDERSAGETSGAATSGREATQAETTTAEAEPTIAVLPFASRSASESDTYFVDGIHDDLLTQLARVGSWKVISRTSVERFRGTTESMKQIGETLGATSIIEGAVQRAGDRVRVNVQLIDAGTDEHLWAETYDRELTADNIFAIQSEIAGAIAAALKATLSPEDQERIGKAQTRNLEAYEAYLLGRERWRARTAESIAESVELFQRAIDLDPAYALAYVGLGDAYRLQVPYGGLPSDEVFPKAERALQTALELDDQLGEAYAALGGLKRQMNDAAGAEAAFQRALELSPNYAPTYNWYGINLRAQGRFEEALEIFLRGIELDPLSVVLQTNAAYAAATLEQFDEMRARIERVIEIDPDSPFGYSGLSNYYTTVRGRYDDALINMAKAYARDPNNPRMAVFLAMRYLGLGDPDMAEQWLARATDVRADSAWVSFGKFLLATYRNDAASANLYAQKGAEASGAELDPVMMLARLRDLDLAEGRPGEARERYLQAFPEILGPDGPRINESNVYRATDVAYLLLDMGARAEARELLDEILTVTESMPLLGPWGSWTGNAGTYALMGKKAEALAELRRAVDAGWRVFWWYYFDHYTVFEGLRDEPEFHAMREVVAADIATQLARVREMEAHGEIPRPGE